MMTSVLQRLSAPSRTPRSMIAAVLFLTSQVVVQAAVAADGAALYAGKACLACHGAEGKAPIADTYPKLAGQNAAYLSQQVRDIRDGKRTNGQSSIMKPIVASLTDEEIEAIASYLAKQN